MGRSKLKYYVYSSVRGTLIDTVSGYDEARNRARSRHLFIRADHANLLHNAHGQVVELNDAAYRARRAKSFVKSISKSRAGQTTPDAK